MNRTSRKLFATVATLTLFSATTHVIQQPHSVYAQASDTLVQQVNLLHTQLQVLVDSQSPDYVALNSTTEYRAFQQMVTTQFTGLTDAEVTQIALAMFAQGYVTDNGAAFAPTQLSDAATKVQGDYDALQLQNKKTHAIETINQLSALTNPQDFIARVEAALTSDEIDDIVIEAYDKDELNAYKVAQQPKITALTALLQVNKDMLVTRLHAAVSTTEVDLIVQQAEAQARVDQYKEPFLAQLRAMTALDVTPFVSAMETASSTSEVDWILAEAVKAENLEMLRQAVLSEVETYTLLPTRDAYIARIQAATSDVEIQDIFTEAEQAYHTAVALQNHKATAKDLAEQNYADLPDLANYLAAIDAATSVADVDTISARIPVAYNLYQYKLPHLTSMRQTLSNWPYLNKWLADIEAATSEADVDTLLIQADIAHDLYVAQETVIAELDQVVVNLGTESERQALRSRIRNTPTRAALDNEVSAIKSEMISRAKSALTEFQTISQQVNQLPQLPGGSPLYAAHINKMSEINAQMPTWTTQINQLTASQSLTEISALYQAVRFEANLVVANELNARKAEPLRQQYPSAPRLYPLIEQLVSLDYLTYRDPFARLTAFEENNSTKLQEIETLVANIPQDNTTVITIVDDTFNVQIISTTSSIAHVSMVDVARVYTTVLEGNPDRPYLTLNIDLYDNAGNKVQPNGPVEVVIPANLLPSGFDKVVGVYHVEGDNLNPMPFIIDGNGDVRFTTTHFSHYAIVMEKHGEGSWSFKTQADGSGTGGVIHKGTSGSEELYPTIGPILGVFASKDAATPAAAQLPATGEWDNLTMTWFSIISMITGCIILMKQRPRQDMSG